MPWRSPVLLFLQLLLGLRTANSQNGTPSVSIASSGEPLPTYGPNDIVVTLFTASRPIPTYGGDSQGILRDWEIEQWVYPLLANAALLAFQEGRVLEGPRRWSGYNFHIIHQDTCPGGTDSLECKNIWAMRGVDRFFGRDHEVHPVPRASILGTWFVSALGQMLSALEVPTLCYGGLETSLDDKSLYPYLIRTTNGNYPMYIATVRIVELYNYTKTTLFHGTDTTSIEMRDAAAELWAAARITLTALDYQQGLSYGLPPDHPEVLSQEPNRASDWNTLLTIAREFNSHVLIMDGNLEDPASDLSAFLASNGLVGAGYLWFSVYPLQLIYGRAMETFALFCCPVGCCEYFDPTVVDGGITFVDADYHPDVPEYALLQEYLFELENRTHDLAPWIANRTADQAPDVFNLDALRDGTLTPVHKVFDVVWLMLLTINDLLLEIGPTFTSEDLLQHMRTSELNATGGRISFNETTGVLRINRVQIRQYQPVCDEENNRIPPRLTFPVELTPLVDVGLLDLARPAGEQLVWQNPLVFHSCAREPPPDEDLPCEPGTFYDRTAGACNNCTSGEFSASVGTSACTPCPAGTFSNSSRQSQCEACDFGHYSAEEGAQSCSSCKPGEFQNEVLQSACRSCLPGTKAEAWSTTLCEPCQVGTYTSTERSTACSLCEDVFAGSTTAQIQSITPLDCICKEGTYKLENGTTCYPCRTGMRCPLGSSMANLPLEGISTVDSQSGSEVPWLSAYPEVLPGYMTQVSEPLRVYRCRKDETCPGGAPGSCADHHDPTTVACGECVTDAYEVNYECRPCSPGSTVWLVLAMFVAVLVMLAISFLANGDVQSMPAATLMIVAVSGLAFSSIQALGVFNQVALPWPQPVRTIVQAAQLLNFDLDILQVSCVVGVGAISRYAARQLLAPLAVPVLIASVIFKKYVPMAKLRRPNTNVMVETANTVGTLYTVFFISIMISALDPFICYSHPGDSGESVRSAPSLLCTSGEHASMIIFGLIAIFAVATPFIVLCLYAVRMYPRYMTLHDHRGFLHATRFLFIRYKPNRYYFQLILLLRALLLCLVPVILPERPSTQVLFMTFLLCAYVVVLEELTPWRAHLCNTLDACINHLLVVVLMIGGLFLVGEDEDGAIVVMSCIAVLGLLAVVVVGFSVGIYRRFYLRNYYDYFICHHKARAAAQARYVKILLMQKKPYSSIFIDSDNLKDLDVLFDIVKARVRHLLVWLTSGTLKRTWCAGEIVTAFNSLIAVTRLHAPGFNAPSQAQLDDMESYLDLVGCNLSEYGMMLSDVAIAYTRLLSDTTTAVVFRESVQGTRAYHRIISDFLTGSASTYYSSDANGEKVPLLAEVPTKGVVMVSDPQDAEATAACGILSAQIGKDVYQINEFGLYLLADYDCTDLPRLRTLAQESACVVVMLTYGSLQSLPQLVFICDIMLSSGTMNPISVPVNVPGFEFPSAEAVEEVWNQVPALQEIYPEAVVSSMVASFFKQVSVLFPTHASKQALETQGQAIFSRVKHLARGSSGLTGIAGTSVPKGSMMRGESSFKHGSFKSGSSFAGSSSASLDMVSPDYRRNTKESNFQSPTFRIAAVEEVSSSCEVSAALEASRSIASPGQSPKLSDEPLPEEDPILLDV